MHTGRRAVRRKKRMTTLVNRRRFESAWKSQTRGLSEVIVLGEKLGF